MKDADGNGIPSVREAYRAPAGRISKASWYIPEGATAGGFETWILIQNPNDAPATMKVTYMTAEGKGEGGVQARSEFEDDHKRW